MQHPLCADAVHVPIDYFIIQNDGLGGLLFYDKEVKDLYQLRYTENEIRKINHLFVGAVLFAIGIKKSAFITKKQKKHVMIKSDDSKAPSLIKLTDDPLLLHFVGDKLLVVVCTRNTFLYSLNSFTQLSVFNHQRAWKTFQHKETIVLLYNELGKLTGKVLRCSLDKIINIANIELKNVNVDKITFPTVNLIVLLEIPYLAIHFKNQPLYLFNLNNTQEPAEVYESPDGNILISSIDNTLVLFNGQIMMVHNVSTQKAATVLRPERINLDGFEVIDQFELPIMPISDSPPNKPILVIDYSITLSSTVTIVNNIFVDQYNSSCNLFHFDFDVLFEKCEFVSNNSIHPICPKFIFFLERGSFAICNQILAQCGSQRFPLWVLSDLLLIVANANLREFTLQMAVRSLIKDVVDPNYIVGIYLETARASSQTNEGCLSESIQSDFIKELSKLGLHDTIKDFIQHHIITDNTSSALVLCNSQDPSIEKYGLDMLKRLGEYKALIDCLICKGRVVEAVRFAESKKIKLDKSIVWEALAIFKNDPIQYQLQWFFLDHQ